MHGPDICRLKNACVQMLKEAYPLWEFLLTMAEFKKETQCYILYVSERDGCGFTGDDWQYFKESIYKVIYHLQEFCESVKK